MIEDEEASRHLYRSRLEDLGHEVVLAPTGAMGLMEAREHAFDLFLVDVSLGSGINGLEVCRRLKAIPKTRRVPVVLISGQVRSRDELHRGYEAGCESFLEKGETSLLEDVVRAMLRLKALQDELTSQNALLEQQNRRLQQGSVNVAEGPLPVEGVARPDGALIVGRDGVVFSCDLGARELFGKQVVGLHLASIAPKSRLEAIVRDVETEIHEGARFDVRFEGGWTVRRLVATVVPTLPGASDRTESWRLVLLYDADKRARQGDAVSSDTRLHPSELGTILEAARRLWGVGAIVGSDARIEALRGRIDELARIDAPVLSYGEEGVGKDLLARCIHYRTPWRGPFLPVRLGSLDEEGVMDELFGVLEEGVERAGAFQVGRAGTVFLDGLELLPKSVQEALAEALETRTFARGGCDEQLPLEVRVLASTSDDPRLLVERGLLSQRLLDSFGPRCLFLPPLRERTPDLPYLVSHLTERYAPGRVLHFSSEVLWALLRHDWPRNVRELEEVLQGVLAETDVVEIGVEHLPLWLRDLADGAPDDLNFSVMPQMPFVETLEHAHASDDDSVSLQSYERRALLRALAQSGGDRLATARLLSIGKSTLYRKLKKHGID